MVTRILIDVMSKVLRLISVLQNKNSVLQNKNSLLTRIVNQRLTNGVWLEYNKQVNEEDDKISSNIIVDRRTNIVHAFLCR